MKFIVKPSDTEKEIEIEGAAYVIDAQGLKIFDQESALLAIFTTYKWMNVQRGQVATAQPAANDSNFESAE